MLGLLAKQCTKCKSLKPLRDFNNYKKGKHGKNARCRECSQEITREYIRSKKFALTALRELETHPERLLARRAIHLAVKAGLVERPYICSKCNKEGPVQAHHEDYHKRLDVQWLCHGCHAGLRFGQ